MPIQRAKPIAADIPVINTSSLPTIPVGKFPSNTVIQRVIGKINSSVNVTNNSAFVATGLYVDITPTLATNDIHLDFDWKVYMHNGTAVSATNWAIYRKIGSGSMTAWKVVSGWDNYLNRSNITSDFYPHQRYFVIDDSHNTTSTVRYEMYVKRYGNSSGLQTYFNANLAFDNTYAPGFSSGDQVDLGLLIAEEMQG